MTTLQIPDDILQHAGISGSQALVELACQLFQTQRLSLFFAAKLAGLPQPDFEELLRSRNIPLYHYTQEDLRQDLQSFQRLQP